MAHLYAWNHTGVSSQHAYYENHFPYDIIRDWCNSENPDRQLYCLKSGKVIVDRYHTSHTTNEMRAAVLRSGIDRIDIGSKTGPQGETISQKLAFDLDSNDYEMVYPGDGATVEEDGLITEGAWAMIALSLGYLGLYLDKIYGLTPRPAYRYIFSGRRGAHLWLDGYDRDDTNLRDVKTLSSDFLPLLKKADAACEAQRLLSNPEHGLDDWLAQVGDYARTSLADACIWNRSPQTTTYLEQELTAIFSEPIEPRNEFFKARVETIEEEVWQAAGLLLIAPRHDVNVTVGKGHLLKSPFSLHHETQLISIPFDPFDMKNCVRDNVCVPVHELVQGKHPVADIFQQSIMLFD